MMQDERWLMKYNEVKSFIEMNHQNPSKHRVEEHLMLNWMKHNRKLLKAGKMASERAEMMGKLVDLWDKYRRVNQYA